MTAQVEPLGGYAATCVCVPTLLHEYLCPFRASGVGESIVKYVETTNQDMLVLGSRGMGAVKRYVRVFLSFYAQQQATEQGHAGHARLGQRIRLGRQPRALPRGGGEAALLVMARITSYTARMMSLGLVQARLDG